MSDGRVFNEEEIDQLINKGDAWLDTLRMTPEVIANLIATIRDRDKTIAESGTNQVKLWECPDCGFAFDAIHTDAGTDKHSCPACAEILLEHDNTIMREALERIEKANYTFCNASDIAREARAQVQANPREKMEALPSTE